MARGRAFLRRRAEGGIVLAARGGGEIAGILCGEASPDWYDGETCALAMLHNRLDYGEAPLTALAARFLEWARARQAGGVYLALPPGVAGEKLIERLGFVPVLSVLRRRLQDDGGKPSDMAPRTVRIIGETPPQGEKPASERILTLAQYRPDLAPLDESAAQKSGDDDGEPAVRRIVEDDIGAVCRFAEAARRASRLPFMHRAFAAQVAAGLNRSDCRWLLAEADDGATCGVLGGVTRRHPFYRGRLACALLLRAKTDAAAALLARKFLRWGKRSRASEAVFILPKNAAAERLRRRLGLIRAGKVIWRALSPRE